VSLRNSEENAPRQSKKWEDRYFLQKEFAISRFLRFVNPLTVILQNCAAASWAVSLAGARVTSPYAKAPQAE